MKRGRPKTTNKNQTQQKSINNNFTRIGMAWVRGTLFVLLTISVNIDVCMAVESTTSSMSTTTMATTMPHETSRKPEREPFSTAKIIATSSAIATPTIRTHKVASHMNASTKSKLSMSESVVILPNSEREAQDIYDKALKQFDSYGVSTRQTCKVWEKRGCQCSGTVDELTLSCRAIGLNEPPTDLPETLIKL